MMKNPGTMMKNALDTVLADISACKDSFVMRPGVDFTRNRVCTFETTMRIILGMHGGSIRKELFDLFPDINKRMTTSALVQQRAKIQSEAFKSALYEFNKATACYDSITYKGYRLFAIDGSAVNVAKAPESDTYFTQGFNQFHATLLHDICNKTFYDVVIQPRPKMNEHAALKEMVRRTSLPEKSIILCDRGFDQYSIYETIKRAGAEYLIRVPDNYSIETRDLPMEELDTDVSIELRTTQTKKDKADFAAGIAKYVSGPSKFGKKKAHVTWEYENPFQLTMRIVRFLLPSGEYETIVTSLNRFEFPTEEIKLLYAKRWGIETAFRELKYDIGLTHLHARKEECVLQEIYAHLLMYNFSMRIAMHVGLAKSRGKHDYQINRANAFYVCRRYFWGVVCNIEAEIASQLLPIRPGRADKRKLIPKSFVAFNYRVA